MSTFPVLVFSNGSPTWDISKAIILLAVRTVPYVLVVCIETLVLDQRWYIVAMEVGRTDMGGDGR